MGKGGCNSCAQPIRLTTDFPRVTRFRAECVQTTNRAQDVGYRRCKSIGVARDLL